MSEQRTMKLYGFNINSDAPHYVTSQTYSHTTLAYERQVATEFAAGMGYTGDGYVAIIDSEGNCINKMDV